MKTIEQYPIGSRFILSNLGCVEITKFDVDLVRFRFYLVSDVHSICGYRSKYRQSYVSINKELKEGTLKPID